MKSATSNTIEGLTNLINAFHYSVGCYIKDNEAFNGMDKRLGRVEFKRNKYIYYCEL